MTVAPSYTDIISETQSSRFGHLSLLYFWFVFTKHENSSNTQIFFGGKIWFKKIQSIKQDGGYMVPTKSLQQTLMCWIIFSGEDFIILSKFQSCSCLIHMPPFSCKNFTNDNKVNNDLSTTLKNARKSAAFLMTWSLHDRRINKQLRFGEGKKISFFYLYNSGFKSRSRICKLIL